MSSNTSQARAIAPAASLQHRVVAATIGGLLGAFMLIGVGFAGTDNFVHNAAHDSRHAHSFPCH